MFLIFLAVFPHANHGNQWFTSGTSLWRCCCRILIDDILNCYWLWCEPIDHPLFGLTLKPFANINCIKQFLLYIYINIPWPFKPAKFVLSGRRPKLGITIKSIVTMVWWECCRFGTNRYPGIAETTNLTGLQFVVGSKVATTLPIIAHHSPCLQLFPCILLCTKVLAQSKVSNSYVTSK